MPDWNTNRGTATLMMSRQRQMATHENMNRSPPPKKPISSGDPSRRMLGTPSRIKQHNELSSPCSATLTPGSTMRKRGTGMSPTSGGQRVEATPSPYPQTSAQLHNARRNLSGVLAFADLDDDDHYHSNEAEPIHNLVNELDSDFQTTIRAATDKLQDLAGRANQAERQELASSGAPKKLVELLKNGVQGEEIIGALQNFAANENEDDAVKEELVRAGAVPAMANLLDPQQDINMEDPSVQVHAIAVLLNLAIASEPRKTIITNHGLLPRIAAFVMSSHVELKRSAILALTSLSIGSERRKTEIFSCDVLAPLVNNLIPEEVYKDLWLPSLGLLQSLVYCNDDRKSQVLGTEFIANTSMLMASNMMLPEDEQVAAKLLKGLAAFQGTISQQLSTSAANSEHAGLSDSVASAATGILDMVESVVHVPERFFSFSDFFFGTDEEDKE